MSIARSPITAAVAAVSVGIVDGEPRLDLPYAEDSIAQVDLNRLQLQRVQFESAIETADVNVRTAKIQLLALLNDSTPLEQFDVTGPFDVVEGLPALDDLRRLALDARPDVRAALEGVAAANINH